MADNSARISLGVDGAGAAARAAEDVSRAWGKAGKEIENGWKNLKSTIAGSVESGIRDVGRVALAVDALDFAGAMRSAQEFRDTVTRMAVASGKDADHLRERFTAIGKEILRKPEEVAAFSRSVARVTYDINKATDAAKVLGREGLFTDRSLDDFREFAVLLSRSTSGVDDMERSVRKLRGEIGKMGVVGGDAAIFDWVNANADTLGKMGGTMTSGPRGEAIAVRAALAKSMPNSTPQEQNEAASGIINSIVSNPRDYERVMGMKWGTIVDRKTGRLNHSLIETIEKSQKYIRRQAGGDETTALYSARNKLGGVPGSGLLGLDTKLARDLMNAPEAAARGPLDSSALTAARARNNAYIAKQRAAGDVVDSAAFQSVQKWAAENPGASMVARPVGFGMAAMLGGKAAAAGLGAAGSTAAGIAALVKMYGAATLATPVAGIVGAGAGGYMLGSAIDEENQLSDRIATMGGGWKSQGEYQRGIELGVANKYHTDFVQTPDAIRTMAAQTHRTIEGNVKAGYITAEEGDTRIAALERQTRKSLRAAGVTGEEVAEIPKAEREAAENKQIVADGMVEGWSTALSRHPISITVLNYSGGPVQAVAGDRAYTPGQ